MGSPEKSISDLLLDAGYRHERFGDSGAHRITRVQTGEFVGFFHAHQAVAFLTTQWCA
jgi:hypothetical protein